MVDFRSVFFLLPLIVFAFGGQSVIAQDKPLIENERLSLTINAAQLELDDKARQAHFSGHVVVMQGDLKLEAGRVFVEYDGSAGFSAKDIRLLRALDSITFTDKNMTAKAQKGVYVLSEQILTLTGDVILIQGEDTSTGQRLIIDRKRGTVKMEGDVEIILQPAQKE